MKKVIVSDYTLRKLGEERTKPLLVREKTALARGIEAFGADVIELPAIRDEKEDAVIVRMICEDAGCVVAIPVQDVEGGAAKAWNCIKCAKKPRLQVMLPTSTVTMEYTYHAKDAAMLAKIAKLCAEAKAVCPDVEFVARDASRADDAFLCKACAAAIENGAVSVTLCDDAGTDLPADIAARVRMLREAVSVPVYVQPSDAMYVGTACAAAALEAGADGIKTSIAGKGIVKTTHLAALLRGKADAMEIETGLRYEAVTTDVSELLKGISHDDGAEPEPTADGGRDILLGKDCTPGDVGAAALSLGYELSSADVGKVRDALVLVCEKGHAVGAEELEAIIATTAMQVPSTYHLKNYVTTSSSASASVSRITLTMGDEEIDGVAGGDGPIDSAFHAIDRIVGFRYELDDFRIRSVTQGREALGSATVRLRCEGKLYSGNGLSGDIVAASIRAYLDALNKIVYEQRKESD